MANSFTNYGKKMKEYLDKRKLEREQEREIDKQEEKAIRKENIKTHSQEARQMAIEHERNKAYATMNDSNAPLSKKIAAINEYYKDHTKPKVSDGMQEMSDHIYMTKYRKDMRMAKLRAINEAVRNERLRANREKAIKLNDAKNRSTYLKNCHKAKGLIKNAKIKLGIRRV